ncbi:hypothetical protein GCM10010430_66100 [Kitasatospora cystarginea]|uniref:4Fe-4S Wbl-type domain-containing protein n=1 Tax=Kitasatospora cystarginea TaxID=58350 RepID=A0ABP5RQD6_9ACTN
MLRCDADSCWGPCHLVPGQLWPAPAQDYDGTFGDVAAFIGERNDTARARPGRLACGRHRCPIRCWEPAADPSALTEGVQSDRRVRVRAGPGQSGWLHRLAARRRPRPVRGHDAAQLPDALAESVRQR